MPPAPASPARPWTRLDRLTDADTRIFHLEAGPIRGHVCKVVVADPGQEAGQGRPAALRSRIERGLVSYPRLRRRLAETPLGVANPAWVDDPGFDLGRHVVPWYDGAPVGPERLRMIVADLMAQRLPRDRPLWRIDVVEPLVDGGTALVIRIHHCLADGMTAGRIIGDVVLDPQGEVPADPQRGAPEQGGAAASGGGAIPGAPMMLALGVRDRALGAAGTAARGIRVLGSSTAWRGFADTARRFSGTLRRELRAEGSESPLDAVAGPTRVVAFTARPFHELHRASKVFGDGVTVNDVVLATVAGGLRRWLERDGAPPADLRAQVPVSLHHAGEDAASSANRDSFMFVDLDLEEPDPVRRLLAISAETQDRKRHHDAEEIDNLLRDMAHVSRSLERLAERWVVRPRVFAVNVSNVPGPRGALSLLGAPVREVHSLAEVANRHALRVSAFSAGGVMSLGFCADAAVVGRGIEALAAGVERELEELATRASGA